MSVQSFSAPPEFVSPSFEYFQEVLGRSYEGVVLKDRDVLTEKTTIGGDELIIRTPGNRPEIEEYTVDELLSARVDALYRGIGITGLEQVLYYSLPERTVVTACAPGEAFKDPSVDLVRSITKSQLGDLFTSLREGRSVDLSPDYASPDNLAYHAESGFTVIDYTLVRPESVVWNHTADMDFAHTLYSFYANIYYANDDEARAAMRDVIKTGVDVLLESAPTVLEELPAAWGSVRDLLLDPVGYHE